MQNTEFKDRRIFERMPIELSLRLLNLHSKKWGLVKTRDISAKGIGLLTEEGLAPYTPLELWLQIPDKGEPLFAKGEVVWSEMIETNKHRVGISLEKADFMGMSRVLRTTSTRTRYY